MFEEKPLQLSGCAIIHDKNILLLYRIEQNHYEFPGGKVEAEEDLETAARREVREEIGVEVEIKKPLGSVVFTNPKNGMLHESHLFLAEIADKSEPEVREVQKFSHLKWIPLEKYTEFPLAPNAKEFCEKWQRGKFGEKS